ncbi:MAG: hypothetical protein WCC84_17160 [Candidatus Cybelea sp.]
MAFRIKDLLVNVAPRDNTGGPYVCPKESSCPASWQAEDEGAQVPTVGVGHHYARLDCDLTCYRTYLNCFDTEHFCLLTFPWIEEISKEKMKELREQLHGVVRETRHKDASKLNAQEKRDLKERLEAALKELE